MKRPFAWLVLLLLITVPPALTAFNLMRLAEVRTARVSAEEMTQAFLQAHPADPEQAAADIAEGLFFNAVSAPMTAAALQNQVAGIIAASGASLDEFEHLEVAEADLPFAAAELRVSFRATIAALQETLYRIEQGYPAVIVETLDVRREKAEIDDPHDEPELRVVLTVRGFSEGTS